MTRFLMLIVFAWMALGATCAAVSSHSGRAQAAESASQVRGSATIELLTPTEGADFNFYLGGVYRAVKKKWFANMPASIAKGQKGLNRVEFRILRDGTVPKEFVKMEAGSGKADLDEASLAGIGAASPFAKLPEKFPASYIELRFTFYYNLEPMNP